MEWSFSDVWYPEGDVEDGCFSSFCMEELVGETPFNYLEYGSNLSNVVNLAGMQYPYPWR